jgi:cytochrome c oxidase assembly factor 1
MTGLSAWAAFLYFVTNQEKISSSVVRQVLRTVRASPEVRELLGEAVRAEPVWWLNGDPRIDGAVSFIMSD